MKIKIFLVIIVVFIKSILFSQEISKRDYHYILITPFEILLSSDSFTTSGGISYRYQSKGNLHFNLSGDKSYFFSSSNYLSESSDKINHYRLESFFIYDFVTDDIINEKSVNIGLISKSLRFGGSYENNVRTYESSTNSILIKNQIDFFIGSEFNKIFQKTYTLLDIEYSKSFSNNLNTISFFRFYIDAKFNNESKNFIKYNGFRFGYTTGSHNNYTMKYEIGFTNQTEYYGLISTSFSLIL